MKTLLFSLLLSLVTVHAQLRNGALVNGELVNAGPAAGGASTLNTDLFGYWKMDEASGTRADSSGSAQTLTDNNTVTSGTGKIGNAGQFTRANSEFLSHADSDELSTGDIDFTIAAWVNPDSLPGNMVIMQKGWDDAYGEYVLYYDTGIADYSAQIANGAASVSTTGDLPAIGTYQLVVFSYDAAANQLRLSVNNGTVFTASYTGGNTTTTGNFKIGLSFGTAYWDGRIDEVGFWKKVLSAAEITELYNGGSGKTCCPFAQ